MKAISILGTSSNAGKSWVSTALCAWLRKQGVRVAPFKAQNMANNAFATLEGGEIGVAQAVQAEACGLRPIVEMNPVLLKPNGPDGSQVVVLGKAGETVVARDYYARVDDCWEIVRQSLDYWKTECDVLVLEGAGSPVELNLMDRDIVNLRPIEYLDGKWILVSNIEYGGVFAQLLGTWQLLPGAMRSRGLGSIVNRFHGDLSLFADAEENVKRIMELPYLGVIPYDESLRIDDEDSLNAVRTCPDLGQPYIAWIRYPRVSNSQDLNPWKFDSGIQSVWCEDLATIEGAAAVVLPGSKNTISDLRWMKERGLDLAVKAAERSGKPVIGICGGMQILGTRLEDSQSGDSESGIGLLPLDTEFIPAKEVCRNQACYEGSYWETFEIHQGVSKVRDGNELESLCEISPVGENRFRPDGYVKGKVWGTYQHSIFDSKQMRKRFVEGISGVGSVEIASDSWRECRSRIYDAMAEMLDQYINLDTVRRYLGL